ncbi:MAG TPA: 4-hydroxybenzoate octaprenyltransferase, partial [Planctomycetota bacterium]|nr:4-hydroxybenzoate octaprenyltransferase [Planctomycetota bacterium]
MSAVASLRDIVTDIKLAHSVFALPFALVGLLFGTRGRWPEPLLLAKVVAALVLARSAAMGWNRLLDRRFDAANPRTARRALPAGRLRPGAMAAFVAVCSLLFVAVAGSINRPCLLLSPAVLAVLFLYSLGKRVTDLTHLLLGLALALAPPAAYLAARGALEADVTPVLWLSGAVLCWVAGFDILYACQDVGFDRQAGLHSIQAWLGVGPALGLSSALHVGTVALLAALGGAAALGVPYLVGLGII